MMKCNSIKQALFELALGTLKPKIPLCAKVSPGMTTTYRMLTGAATHELLFILNILKEEKGLTTVRLCDIYKTHNKHSRRCINIARYIPISTHFLVIAGILGLINKSKIKGRHYVEITEEGRKALEVLQTTQPFYILSNTITHIPDYRYNLYQKDFHGQRVPNPPQKYCMIPVKINEQCWFRGLTRWW